MRKWLLLFSCLVQSSAGSQVTASLSYEDVVRGLVTRDSLTRSVTLTFSTLSSFSDGQQGVLPCSYEYVFRNDWVYAHTIDGSPGNAYEEVATFNGQSYLVLVPAEHKSYGGFLAPWGNRTNLQPFFRLGLQPVGEPLMGGWFQRKSGSLIATTQVDGHTTYVISDGGKESPPSPNGEGYIVWVAPDFGFSPLRVQIYRKGALHHVYEFMNFKQDKTGVLWVPQAARVWYFDVGKRVTDFDPTSPDDQWLARVDVEIQSIVYNKSYEDAFFNPEIPGSN